MKRSISLILLFVLLSMSNAQDKKVVETDFKVFGNCNMCKNRIEKAVKISEVKFAKWDKKSKMLKVAFESTITADSLQKRIAAVGHDTEKFKANDEVYKNLPGCCLYRDKPTTH
ncbi:MAG: hypothetical protein KF816_15485 [Melioribacteraceae bacterium]|jgi:hypothetical protein|nr:hypothetical protein [Melioribacteraceae bacterium]